METLTISLGQIAIIQDDPQSNFAKIRDWTIEAARRGSHIIVFPELWCVGGVSPSALKMASPLYEGIFHQVAELARECQIYILGSNLAILGDNKFGNTSVLFSPNGIPIATYTKIHLFRLMDEHLYLTAGDHLSLVETNWGKIGLSICYDLRFAEVYRTYALGRANIVFVPAAWPHPRLNHWQVLLRARAIENQMYIVACNRVGKQGKTHFFGNSCVIDPWGETLIQSNECEALLTISIQLNLVDDIRQRIPVFVDRNPDAYHY